MVESGNAVPSTEDITAIVEAMAQGATPADAAGIDQSVLEALYALAHSLYTAGKYQDAEVAFQALCLYDYHDPRFWMGLGAAQQGLGKLEIAIEVYSMAGLTATLKDPTPFYHAGLCYLKLGNVEGAEAAFNGLLTMGEAGNAEYDAVKAKAKNMLEVLAQTKKAGAK